MKYVIGCTADERGREAISLALTLARSLADPSTVSLELVHIIRGEAPENTATQSEKTFQQFQYDTAMGWMQRCLDLVPSALDAQIHIRFADSMAGGMLEAAAAFNADLVVIGAASHGPLRRFTVGSVANALLHSSPVPVALAPSGYRPPRLLTRITCALGTRSGSEAVLQSAVEAAAARHVPLRLVSLVALDLSQAQGISNLGQRTQAHSSRVLDEAVSAVAHRTVVTAEVAQGRSIEAAINTLDWDEEELVLIGSSRLAERSKIFMGATANKMLRALPVPMVVVPRYHIAAGSEPAARL
ncbi:nucleotide-binding universal stress UspA family protein [Arthrobacter sp. AG1021]|uniref:universal stress protein n=1 Tax=Arthrobacter sp. AG1021 TaxID=2183908 RepID=UPI0006B2576E|nr:universal stress protein [Arthrobacter sp. AG1021]ALD62877.1 universal stress protein UspA [Arthrobacter sp. LS16]RKS17304.1 nucleotide-binding universal stress UspA family protein [Arthrobacter sp. AG1021]